MASYRYGGQSSDVKYGVEITAESPDGISESAPQNQGDLYKLGGPALDGTQLKAVPLVAGDTPTSCVMLQAKHRMTQPDKPAGYKVIGGGKPSGIYRLPYNATDGAPTLGQSVQAAATGSVKTVSGKAWANGQGTVVAVNTADLEVEVLI